MLQLFVNNQQLDTSGISFTLNIKNPMFTEKLEGSYIYSLNIPATERNNKIFGFPGRLEKFENTFTGTFRMIDNGIETIPSATIIAKKTTEKTITANVTVGFGDIIYNLKEVYLKDINLGGNRVLSGEVFIPVDYYNDTVLGEYPEFDFVLFPVYNENFYEGTDQETNWKSNIKIVNEYFTGSFQPTSPDDTGGTLVPFPYVVYILNQIFKQYGYSTGENVFYKNADLRRLVLYNNFSDIVTVVVEDPGPPITFSYSSKANHRIDLKNQVPDYKVLDFLNDLRFLSVGFFINPVTNNVDIKFLKDIIRSTDFDDITSNVISFKSKNNETLFDGFKFAYALSQDSWGDEYFKNEIADYILKDPVPTSLDLPIDENTEVNEIRLVQDIDTYFIFRWDEVSSNFSWFYFMYHYFDLQMAGSRIFNVAPECAPLFVEQIIVDNPSTRVKLLPKIAQPGTNKFFVKSDTKELFVNDPGKRFLFYRGMQHDSLAGSYPLGSPDVYDLAGDKIEDANLSLKWEGTYGLYEQLWAPVIQFLMQTKEVEVDVIMTAAEFKQFDLSRKKRISGIDFLVKEVKVQATDAGITKATMTLYKA